MSQNHLHLFHSVFAKFFFLLLHLPLLPAPPILPEQPDPASIQPFNPNPTPPATIPAFPEQSDLAECPLDLPEELFHGIRNACGGNTKESNLRRSRCCPVLAAWLYSSYSAIALGRVGREGRMASVPYDLPVLPDDSETCVDDLEKALKGKGVELRKPNETCDVVYCYCGIRLHPLSCPEAFSVSKEGKLVGDEKVKRLERDCLNEKVNGEGYSSLAGCSKCLNRLYQLNEGTNVNKSKLSDRKSKMENRDCEQMGLTWLLSKNRSAYIPTVTTVLRALMMSTDGSDPQSCTLTSDGMPLAIDSSQLDDQSSSNILQFHILTLPLIYFCVCIILSILF